MTPILFILFARPACSFFEAFFEQAFQFGAGGGGHFHFEMNGGRANNPHQAAPPTWPSGVPSTIDPAFSWLKGTEWLWSNWKPVRFHADGSFEAPSPECTPSPATGGKNPCRWSASAEKIFILWGRAGIHSVRPKSPSPSSRFPDFEGIKEGDKSRVFMSYLQTFEEQELWRLLGFGSSSEFVSSSDPSELKKRYRRLSLELHPDKVGRGNYTATEAFRRMTEAYEILSDPVKRFIYDIHGREGLGRLERGEFPKGESRVAEIKVPLELMYKGGELEIEIPRRVVCVTGSNGECNQKCPAEVQTITRQVGGGFFVQQQVRVESKFFCKKRSEKEVIGIPQFASEGTEIVLTGRGDQAPDRIPGDVVVRVFGKTHGEFKRNGADLELKNAIKIGISEAMLGFKKEVVLLDGETVEVGWGDSGKVVQHGQVFVFEGRGFGGDFKAKVEVVFPKKLNNHQKTLVRDYF